MIDSEIEIHNTRLLIRTLNDFLNILGCKHTHTRTHAHTHTHTYRFMRLTHLDVDQMFNFVSFVLLSITDDGVLFKYFVKSIM